MRFCIFRRRLRTSPCLRVVKPGDAVTMNREEIEQKMDELAREFAETHDPEVRDEIYRLAHQLKELDH
jgi:FKBP-type peptidyl-prolyl cis-trans isomerase (trigger factor)